MRFSLMHGGRTAVVVAAGLGSLALAGSLPAVASATAAARPAAHTASTGSSHAVIVNCLGKARVAPHSFVLTCADGNDALAGMRWASWPSAGPAAFGRGTQPANDCIPNCAQGHIHHYPVLVTLWRAEPRPHHAGQRHYTRVTVIYTGKRPAIFHPGGKSSHPQTFTFHLRNA